MPAHCLPLEEKVAAKLTDEVKKYYQKFQNHIDNTVKIEYNNIKRNHWITNAQEYHFKFCRNKTKKPRV